MNNVYKTAEVAFILLLSFPFATSYTKPLSVPHSENRPSGIPEPNTGQFSYPRIGWACAAHEVSARYPGIIKFYCFPSSYIIVFQIVIQYVSYGLYNKSEVNNAVMSDELTKTCIVPEAVRTVEEKCHGKNECLILVGPAAFVIEFPDPCPNLR